MANAIYNYCTISGEPNELDMVRKIFSCFNEPKKINEYLIYSQLFDDKLTELQSKELFQEDLCNEYFKIHKSMTRKDELTDDEYLCAVYFIALAWFPDITIRENDDNSIFLRCLTRHSDLSHIYAVISEKYKSLTVDIYVDVFGVSSYSETWSGGELLERTDGESFELSLYDEEIQKAGDITRKTGGLKNPRDFYTILSKNNKGVK